MSRTGKVTSKAISCRDDRRERGATHLEALLAAQGRNPDGEKRLQRTEMGVERGDGKNGEEQQQQRVAEDVHA